MLWQGKQVVSDTYACAYIAVKLTCNTLTSAFCACDCCSGVQGLGGLKWLGRKVVTEVEPCGDYYLAEAYHQQYLERGGRMGARQSAAKGCNDPIRCYG